MNLHQLAEERSLAYHALIAGRLEENPELLEAARRRVAGWVEASAPHPHYTHDWSAILASPPAVIRERLLDPSEKGRELRQVTPFAGLIDPRERWRLWREVRERVEHDFRARYSRARAPRRRPKKAWRMRVKREVRCSARRRPP